MKYKKGPVFTSRLHDKTLELLRDRPRDLSLEMIALKVGVKVSWLSSILAHPEISPSVDKIEALYNYLSPRPLKIKTPINGKPSDERLCEICGSQPRRDRRLNRDHCHMTGKQRGILCHGCNVALGFMKDNPVLLRKAAEYLEKHQTGQ